MDDVTQNSLSPWARAGLMFAWGFLKGKSMGALTTLDVRELQHERVENLAIIPGLEETVFRGAMLVGTKYFTVDPTLANVTQAAAFSIYHQGAAFQTVDTFIGGLVYGDTAQKFGLLHSFLVHSSHNLGVDASTW